MFRYLSGHFEQARRSHTATDAHGDDHVLHTAALALDQRVADHARAAHAVGMANGNSAAIDVEFVVVDTQLIAAVNHLHREGFIQFPQADVADLQAGLLEQLGHGKDRADTHLVGSATGNGHAAVNTQ